MTSKIVCTGFYYTADLAHRDAAGDYKLIGRRDDAIRTPTAWLSVTEIENAMVSRLLMMVSIQGHVFHSTILQYEGSN